jgi:hypothetical protein
VIRRGASLLGGNPEMQFAQQLDRAMGAVGERDLIRNIEHQRIGASDRVIDPSTARKQLESAASLHWIHWVESEAGKGSKFFFALAPIQSTSHHGALQNELPCNQTYDFWNSVVKLPPQ